jgi:hypothetical protein
MQSPPTRTEFLILVRVGGLRIVRPDFNRGRCQNEARIDRQHLTLDRILSMLHQRCKIANQTAEIELFGTQCLEGGNLRFG